MIEFTDDEVQMRYDMLIMEQDDLEYSLQKVQRQIQDMIDNPNNKRY